MKLLYGLKHKAKLLTVFLLLPICAHSQQSHVSGILVDNKSKLPVIGVVIRLAKIADTTDVVSTSSDRSGLFSFANMNFGSYRLQASRVGYTTMIRRVAIDSSTYDLGTMEMAESAIPLKEVVVESAVPPALQKGDTTEFNAGAFKMNRDAVAEDLVAKMPGVTIENGTVKTQGEDVQRVLVDGKPFFGNDPTMAMRNLPADVIDKIQVFDKMSEQSEFMGFDDGRSVKTMNFVTRPERRNGRFGKAYGGYGDGDRYLGGGNVNSFQAEKRISFLGLANNVNQQNFSTQDLLGATGGGGGNRRGGFFGGGGPGGGRGGRGGFGGQGGGGQNFGGGGGASNNFLVGQQNGITTTNSIGLNYTDTWWNKLEMSQSYFFNYARNRNDQDLHRQYLAVRDSVTLYDEVTRSDNNNYNHRYDGRFEISIDSSQSLIVQPKLYFQNNRASSTLSGMNSSSTSQLINSAMNDNGKTSTGHDLSNQLTYRYRFPQRGRTLSADLRMGMNRKDGSGELRSLAEYYDPMGTTGDTLDQHSTAETDGVTFSSRIAYTEPLTDDGILQFSYNPSYSKNNSDNRKFNFDASTQTYTELDTSLTNSYDNTYTTHNAGLGYRLRGSTYNITADLAYQIAALHGEQTYPVASMIDKTFYTILPSAMLNIRPSEQSNLRLFYRTSTREPSISQLQDVIDNSNPLLLSTGNPDLKQSYNHTLVARYSLTSAERSRSFFILVSAGSSSDYIGNATLIAQRDTMLAGGLTLSRGAQLTLPVNLDGSRNLRTFLTYGVPLDFLQSNLNFNSGVTYTRTPGMINDELNNTSSTAMSAGAVLGSNVSEDLDFTLSYSGSYNVARNSAQAQLDNEYYTHAAGVKLNWTFWQGIVFRTEFTNTLYNGSTGNLHERSSLWNINFGKKFLADDRGEIRASVTDVLNQNQSINRSVTETYIEDSENNVLGRYFMIVLTYMLR